MHTTRGTIGFVTLLAMVCGLVLGGFSSPAAAHRAEAHRIVVTSNKDVVDPPFNVGGLCGSGGTVADLPRAGSGGRDRCGGAHETAGLRGDAEHCGARPRPS